MTLRVSTLILLAGLASSACYWSSGSTISAAARPIGEYEPRLPAAGDSLCLDADFSWWSSFPGQRITLRTDSMRASDEGIQYFPLRPSVMYRFSHWTVVDRDIIEISWIGIHDAVIAKLRLFGDSAVGEIGPAGGAGSYWGPAIPRREITGLVVECSAPRTDPPPAGAAKFEYWVGAGVRLSATQKASAELVLARKPGIVAIAVEPGLTGGQLGAGLHLVSPLSTVRLQAVVLRTWGSPWVLEGSRTYPGIEARFAVFGLGLGAAVYSRPLGSKVGPAWRFIPSILIGM